MYGQPYLRPSSFNPNRTHLSAYELGVEVIRCWSRFASALQINIQ